MEEREMILKCPACGFDHLCQEHVEIFNRPEDAQKGIHITASEDRIIVDDNLINNPSPRRQGVTILCRCEECDHSTRIHIYQHKGQTYFEVE